MDIKKSTQDLEYWKNITHNYISKTQFDTYKQECIERGWNSAEEIPNSFFEDAGYTIEDDISDRAENRSAR